MGWSTSSQKTQNRRGVIAGSAEKMSAMSKAGDWAFKALVGGLSVTTVYLAATFSVNVYRGFAWHKAQAKMEQTDASDQTT